MKTGKFSREFHPLDTPEIPGLEGPVFVFCRIPPKQNTTEESEETVILCPSEFVSARHAQVFFKNGAFWLRDLASTNGTFLNGEEILENVDRELRFGDKIRLGRPTREDGYDVTELSTYFFTFVEYKESSIGAGNQSREIEIDPLDSSSSSPVLPPQTEDVVSPTRRQREDSSSSIEILEDSTEGARFETSKEEREDFSTSSDTSTTNSCPDAISNSTQPGPRNAPPLPKIDSDPPKRKPGPACYHRKMKEKYSKPKEPNAQSPIKKPNEVKLQAETPNQSGPSQILNPIPSPTLPEKIKKRPDYLVKKRKNMILSSEDDDDDSSDGMTESHQIPSQLHNNKRMKLSAESKSGTSQTSIFPQRVKEDQLSKPKQSKQVLPKARGSEESEADNEKGSNGKNKRKKKRAKKLSSSSASSGPLPVNNTLSGPSHDVPPITENDNQSPSTSAAAAPTPRTSTNIQSNNGVSKVTPAPQTSPSVLKKCSVRQNKKLVVLDNPLTPPHVRNRRMKWKESSSLEQLKRMTKKEERDGIDRGIRQAAQTLKQRLASIATRDKPQMGKSHGEGDKAKAPTVVKNTRKNRGDFLVESMLPN